VTSSATLGNSAPIRLEEPAVKFLRLHQHCSFLLKTRALCSALSEGLLKHSLGFGDLLHDGGLPAARHGRHASADNEKRGIKGDES
jgi:hypothetical protein